MTGEQALSEREVFQRAVTLAARERAVYLDEACGDNVTLRREVESLLAAHDEAASFMEQPAFELPAEPNGPTAGYQRLSEGPGTVIGPYKLLEQIGEGGFGVVYLAEQERPIKRRVALKIIKPGMDTRQVIARFEAERQALALMDHPNIAKVLDAGTTETGRPYFVMELVQGVPITDYCDQCNLSTRERLELFVSVCQAVQHAHQKGVIHRDIKPTNVLVAIQDGRAAPKIIDFGVAKAINQRLTEHTLATGYAQIIGTPLYMSPEQAELSPLGADTRSDIYSLGVLLYELLTGSTPFDKDRLHSVPYDELRRIIREEEPPRPSARISTLNAAAISTIAERRHTDARRLRQTVRGELDWIVMKCLEKDRNRRYETASGLSRDVERYLNDEPVQACPPSAGYRFRKFARRNKTLLGAAGAIAAALAVGLGLFTWQYFRATTESARAKWVSDLLQQMLSSADAAQAKGADYKVRELLDDFSAGLGSQLTGEPKVEADIRATIARAYRSLKLPDKAQPHFEKSIELQRNIDGAPSENLAAILVDYAWNLQDQQKYAEAESQLNEALEIYRQRGVTGGPLFHALEILQHILINAGRDDDAERVTDQALAVARQSGEESPDQANLLHRYAGLKIRQKRFAEAEKLARQSVDMHRRLHSDQHPETAFALTTLVRALKPQQKFAEAEQAVREALKIFRHQFPEDHPNVRDTMYQLRSVLEARGDKAALEALAKEEAVYAMRSGTPDYHVRLTELLSHKSMDAARTEEAHRQIREAIEAYGRMATEYPNDLDRRVRALDGYALAIRPCVSVPGLAGEVDELNRRLEAELPKLVAAFPDSSDCQWSTARIYRDWGNSLFNYSAYLPVAEHAFSEAKEILEKLSLSDPKRPGVWLQLAYTYSVLGEIQWRSGKLRDADAAFRHVIEIQDEHAAEIEAESNAPTGIAISCIRLAYFLAGTHREEEATVFVRRTADAMQRVKEPVELVHGHYLIAIAQLRLGDEAGYRATCQALVDVPLVDDDASTKVRQIYTWCLAPNALENLNLPVKRAEELAASNTVDQPHVVPYALGAALYRAGQYERAAVQLQQSIAAYPSDPRPGFETINSQRLLLAMTRWQMGKKEEARRLFAETEPAINQDIQSPSVFYPLKAALEVLRREAENLIEPKEADEAVENKSRTSDDPQP